MARLKKDFKQKIEKNCFINFFFVFLFVGKNLKLKGEKQT